MSRNVRILKEAAPSVILMRHKLSLVTLSRSNSPLTALMSEGVIRVSMRIFLVQQNRGNFRTRRREEKRREEKRKIESNPGCVIQHKQVVEIFDCSFDLHSPGLRMLKVMVHDVDSSSVTLA